MKVLSVFTFLFVTVTLSLASLAAAEHLTRDAASSTTDRDEAVTQSADTNEATQTGYWAAWAEAAAH
jgi:hypothetical protein